MQVPNPIDNESRLVLLNCQEKYHGDLVHPGDLVRYSVDDSDYDGGFTGTLIDIVQ